MSFKDHILRKDDPHRVTKEQAGLSNIKNYPLATPAILKELSSDSHYIQATEASQIQDLFTQHMKDIGLMDENGNIISSPLDKDGELEFEILPSGDVTISGTHPVAVTVDVTVTLNRKEVFEESGIEIIDQSWEADTSNLVLDPDDPYILDTIYRDADGNQISRDSEMGGKIPTLSDGQGRLLVFSADNTGSIMGRTPGAAKVDVLISQDGAPVLSAKNIASDGTWAKDLGTTTFDPNVDTLVEVIGWNSSDEIIGKHLTDMPDSILVVDGDFIEFTATTEGIGNLEGYIPGAVRVEATVHLDGQKEYENLTIPTEGTQGHWETDISDLDVREERDPTVTIKAYDQNGELIFGDVAKLDGVNDGDGNEGAELPEEKGGVWYTDEDSGIEYYDMRHFKNWEGVEIDWLDFGEL